MKYEERLKLLKEIGNRKSRWKPMSKLGMGYFSEKTVFCVVDELCEIGLIRLFKKDNKTLCELTDNGRRLLMCDSPIDELTKYFEAKV